VAPAPVALIGFDALEASVLAADPGRYPSFAALQRAGASARLIGLEDAMTDSVWPEIRTGTSSIHTGVYYQPRQFRSGGRTAEMLDAGDLLPERYYWNLAAGAGLAACALDQPFAGHFTAQPSVEIDWGTHDRFFEAPPPGDPAVARLLADAGEHPVGPCDARNDGSDRARADILRRVLDGVEGLTRLALSLVDLRAWDLFTMVHSASHCAGHHLWPMHPNDPRTPSTAAAPESIDQVYLALDASLGRMLDALEGATVIVYTSHGMRSMDFGPSLVPVVLEKMGLTPSRRRRRRMAAVVPAGARRRIAAMVGVDRLQRAGLTMDTPIDAPGTAAVPLPNSGIGALRLALAGRDPGGTIVRGSAEHRKVVEDLRAEFLALRMVDGDECPVRDVVETDELFGVDRHPDLPDLLVRFRPDVGYIGACRSPSLGEVAAPRTGDRTGEHGPPGAVWVVGPGVAPGSDLGAVRTIDLAPSVLSLLGLDIPDWMDGSPVVGRA
jgi:predicted AlkP superfamily phosphohydrolase/phosphomutase